MSTPWVTHAFVWLQAASCLYPAQQNGCSIELNGYVESKESFSLGISFFSLHTKSNLSLINCQFLNVCAFWFWRPFFLTYSNCPVLPQGPPGDRVAGTEWVNSLRRGGERDQMQTTRTLTTKTHETAASRMTVAATPISLSSFAVRYLMQRKKGSQCLACSVILAVQCVPLSHWRKALHHALNEETATQHYTTGELNTCIMHSVKKSLYHAPGDKILVSYPR